VEGLQISQFFSFLQFIKPYFTFILRQHKTYAYSNNSMTIWCSKIQGGSNDGLRHQGEAAAGGGSYCRCIHFLG
jgi:hypothetical protein